MSTGNQIGCTSALEEEAIDRIYPWKCYSQDLTTFTEHVLLEEMCRSKGVTVEAVEAAIKFNKGNLGEFHFVKR